MSQERFDKAAGTWDEMPGRRQVAAAIVVAMKEVLPLTREMAALEIGCGTGLLTCELAGLVDSIVATDTSSGMLAVLAEKVAALGLANVKAQRLDLLSDKVAPAGFALVYSAMTLHHIKDTKAVLAACFDALHGGGILTLADLEKEDGSFHDDMTGVEHCGFDLSELAELAVSCGFVDVRFTTAHRIRKEKEVGKVAEYPIFLMTARKS